ncbi:Gfo/Idh/MocA family oxidoreductase [Acuticoccus sp. M5D2P5]|uniref:Gfo/Idh/MocA family protein n=1 Tax=Acuticoccus kalidii TaxID=2910977 RepID=UPI001F3C079F|nr:Gfo/Idh/MocA family oxidoreductase [Acuticoccus kalidii]MCF3935232.1 Gfo/Idh/MocA family oxidoreductase [Acuticoccus kalidii]
MSTRIAVIGAGVMGADHARILASEVAGAVLQVVCDQDAERAEAVAEATGAVHAATDAAATVIREDVDAVLIASPDKTHAALTIAAIERGKPVLCEKPLAPTSAEAWPVIEAEVRAGRRLVQVGFMRRFDPPYRDMRAAVEAGALGRPMLMHNVHRNVETPFAWFTADMAITNSAPHEFDIARFVLGSEFRAMSAFKPQRDGERIPPVFMVLETEAGQLVNVEINNNAAYGYDVRGELVFEKGSVLLNAAAPTRTYADFKSYEPYAPDWRDRFAEAYRRQAMAWLRSIETGRPSDIAANAWDGFCATFVAEAGVAALAGGGRVPITYPAKPALYGPA